MLLARAAKDKGSISRLYSSFQVKTEIPHDNFVVDTRVKRTSILYNHFRRKPRC